MNFLINTACFIALLLAGLCQASENLQDLQPVAKIVSLSSQQRATGAPKYLMLFKGFVPNQSVIVSFSRGLQLDTQAYHVLEKVQIDEKGKVFTDEGVKLDGYALHLEGIARGERVRYRLSQPNGTILTEVSYVPKPIRKKSKEKTFAIEAEILAVSPTTYTLTCKGIAQGETLKIRTACAKEVTETETVYQDKQNLRVSLGSESKKGGTGSLQIIRENGDRVALRLKWGNTLSGEAKE